KPDDRFQSPAELADVLAGFRISYDVPPPPPTTPWPNVARKTAEHRRPLLPRASENCTPATVAVSPPVAVAVVVPVPVGPAPSPMPSHRWPGQTLLVAARLMLLFALGGLILSHGSSRVEGDAPSLSANEPSTPIQAGGPAAELVWCQLTAKAGRGRLTPQQLLAFRAQFPGSDPAYRATVMLQAYPSPLARLDPARLPTPKRFTGLGLDVVAVVGERKPGFDGSSGSVAFSADGSRLARVGADGRLHLWHCASLHELPPPAAPPRLRHIAWSPDGRYLAGGAEDGSVLLWDVVTGKSQIAPAGHEGAVTGLAFSPTGKLLATCGGDGQVKLWDPDTAELLGTIEGSEGNAAT